MQRETILDTPYATLWYYPEFEVIHHQFHKYIHGDELRDVLSQGLALFQERGAQKWLSDDRKNSALPQEDIDWAQQYWLSPMIASGWKYWAAIMPDSPVGKANMKRVINAYASQGIRVEIFELPEEALEWLESAKSD